MKKNVLSFVIFVFFVSFAWSQNAEIPQNTSKEVDALLTKAQRLYEQGNTNEAINVCKKILALKPQDMDQLWEAGEILIDCQKVMDGMAILKEVVGKQPSYARHRKLAGIADKNNQFSVALEHYEACLKIKPSADTHHKIASVLEEVGQIEKSLAHRSDGVTMVIDKIRGLKFKEIVQMQSKSRKELEQFLIQELEKELPPDKAYAMEAGLKAFGLIPKDCDIKKTMVRLLTEQVAGFYNPDTKKLYLIQEEYKKGFWQNLLNTRRDDSEDLMIIAHEMTHALQDQHYDIREIEKKVKENDDRLLAYQSLLEGDATISMIEYQQQPMRVSKMHIPALKMSFGLISFLMPFMGGKEFSKTPRILRESLLFPYNEGMFFCLEFKEETGWDNIDKMYKNVPASTEQILHPDKYASGEPVWDCKIPNLSQSFGKDWHEVVNNVMGEFSCIVLFDEYMILDSKQLAAGWGGDRYVVMECAPAKNTALVWLTYWDTARDASEFINGYKQIWKKKYPMSKWEEKPGIYQSSRDGFTNAMLVEDKKVFVLEGIPTESASLIYAKLKEIRFEKTPFVK